MQENTRKSFYIFLTMLLGVLLFLMLQRAGFLIAFLAGVDVSTLQLQALSMVTSAIAVAFGAWYGIWLGLVWYAAVYEERTTRSIFGWLRDTTVRRESKKDGSWEFDDLLAMEKETGEPEGAHLEYFESNTVSFGGDPVPAHSVHATRVPVSGKKTSAKRPARKATARKSVA